MTNRMTHFPRKHFGQHFLSDSGVIHRIVAAIAPKLGEHIVEIGPGQGAITVPLLRLVKTLDAIEIDKDLIEELRKRCKGAGHLQVYLSDALSFDYSALKQDERLLRVVGNLPYNISTPLIFHLLKFNTIIQDMVFMLQKEVALRMVAVPGNKEYGRLSVMTQYHCDIKRLFDVPPAAFYPPPEVQSTVITMQPYQDPPYRAVQEQLLETIVRTAFGQRRKTLRNSLKQLIDDKTWENLPIASDRRPEELSVQEFVTLSNALAV